MNLAKHIRTLLHHRFSNISRRKLHLAPPFLLDDYIPRYHQLSSIDASKKRSAAYAHLRNCNLCPRLCGVNRYEKTGACLIGAETVKVNVIAPHFGEEPCIQGHNGSGSVFFSGCNLRCVFCQNHDIAHQRNGQDLTPEELGEWYIKLQNMGQVHNINLITPEHVVPQVVLSILHARELGLNVPIIYNTSAFDSLKSIELLDGLVDIYLPDFKVWKDTTSSRLLKVPKYTETARESVKARQAQVGDLCLHPMELLRRGYSSDTSSCPGMRAKARRSCGRWPYHRDAHVGKPKRPRRVAMADSTSTQDKAGAGEQVRYEEINRHVSREEISAVHRAAEEAGLWRFCDPPKHDGFAI